MAVKSLYDVASLRAKLADIDAAIDAAGAGQSYSIGGRTLTRQSLPELRDERSRLIRDIKRTESALEGVRNPSSAIATWT